MRVSKYKMLSSLKDSEHNLVLTNYKYPQSKIDLEEFNEFGERFLKDNAIIDVKKLKDPELNLRYDYVLILRSKLADTALEIIKEAYPMLKTIDEYKASLTGDFNEL